MINLPPEFCERMKTLLGNDYEKFMFAMCESPVKACRINKTKISVEDYLALNELHGEKVLYCETGMYLKTDKVGGHPFHHAGMIYVQEPAAMLPAEAVDIEDGSAVLDMCAAPGGKASRLREKFFGGVLVANEIVPQRCRVLTGNVERLGLKDVITTCASSEKIAQSFGAIFDLVNVDAPCSGEGMFRKDEKAVAAWTEANVKMCAERQAEILDNAALCVKNDGKLLYSTCTYSPEENEMTVAAFLRRHPEFTLIEPKEAVIAATVPGVRVKGTESIDINLCRRFYPHIGRGEGQFFALMQKKNGGDHFKKAKSVLSPCKNRLLFDFLEENLKSFKAESVKIIKDTPVIFAPEFELPPGLSFSCGVTIGEIKGNYVKPHHQLFSAFGNDFKRQINFCFDDEMLIKYLRGEEISADCGDGWAAVMVNGCSVGGAKVSGGRAKNHYPRGLRLVK